MAGFGSLGGIGGAGNSFVSRVGSPNSQTIYTDDHLNKEFNDWAAAKQAQLGSISDTAAAENVAAGAWNRYKNIYTPYAEYTGMNDAYEDRDAWLAMGREYGQTGSVQNPIEGNYENWLGGMDEALASNQYARDALSGELAQRRSELDQTMSMRGENFTRQTQAYNNMAGNGLLNGVIGPGYMDPNFGQVSGQGSATVPNIPGVDMDWAKGLGGLNGNGSWSGTFGAPEGQAGTYGAPTKLPWEI